VYHSTLGWRVIKKKKTKVGCQHLLSLQGAGFRVQGAGCRVQGAGFRVQGSGCRVQGLGFRV